MCFHSGFLLETCSQPLCCGHNFFMPGERLRLSLSWHKCHSKAANKAQDAAVECGLPHETEMTKSFPQSYKFDIARKL